MVKKLFYNFTLSFALGACIQLFLQLITSRPPQSLSQNEESSLEENHQLVYDKWLYNKYGYQSFSIDPDIVHYDRSFKEEMESDFLRREIRIRCIILSESVEGSKAIRDTWGSHCNSIQFLSSKISNASIPIVKMSVKSSFELYCEFLRKEFEGEDSWIFIAKERTFAVMENLRFYLASKDPLSPLYLGHPRVFWNVAYNWINAGIVLSPGSIRAFKSSFRSKEECTNGGRFWGNGDWYLGKYFLDRLNITPSDTRDHVGRGRFNGFSIYRLIFPGGISLLDNYWKDSLYVSPVGPQCCSKAAVTFHDVPSNSKMYQMYYLFYRLISFPSGGGHGNKSPPNKNNNNV